MSGDYQIDIANNPYKRPGEPLNGDRLYFIAANNGSDYGLNKKGNNNTAHLRHK